jgi:hypothetical protein
MSDRADWQEVGVAFRDLGRQLKGKAVEGGQAVREANAEAGGPITDKVSAVFTTALEQFDQTSADPEVTRAARTATARLLDAIKAELTGEGADEPRDPEPPSGPPPVSG